MLNLTAVQVFRESILRNPHRPLRGFSWLVAVGSCPTVAPSQANLYLLVMAFDVTVTG